MCLRISIQGLVAETYLQVYILNSQKLNCRGISHPYTHVLGCGNRREKLTFESVPGGWNPEEKLKIE